MICWILACLATLLAAVGGYLVGYAKGEANLEGVIVRLDSTRRKEDDGKRVD